ncbi:MAG: hypothetical protein HYR60_02290 [Acidobacteria bacterium]|nr:hypothetical protein [Acidobacteriota bacterium]
MTACLPLAAQSFEVGFARQDNYAAHPTNLPAKDLLVSADYPGVMMQTVEQRLGGPTPCFSKAPRATSPRGERTDRASRTMGAPSARRPSGSRAGSRPACRPRLP